MTVSRRRLGLYAMLGFLAVGCLACKGGGPIGPTVPVSTVTVAPPSSTLEVGLSIQLSATPRGPAGQALNSRPVTWSSSNETVATVNGSGRVTTLAAGLVTIRATAEGKTGEASLRVLVAQVTAVDVQPDSFTLVAGDRRPLVASARSARGPISGCAFSFVSRNPAVATAGAADGLVVARSAGRAAIDVTASCGEAGAVTSQVSVEVLAAGVGDMIPLTDAPIALYKGLALGLFDGTNVPPAAHDAAGIASGAAVRPINGKIVLISIGMSNATQEFDTWRHGHEAAAGGAWRNGAVWMVDCARGSADVTAWDSPLDEQYDRCRDIELAPAGLTEADVQVVWGKLVYTDAGIPLPAPNADAVRIAADCGEVIAALRSRYPNLKQVFLSSRIYGGYGMGGRAEPIAYENGFGIRRCILDDTTPTFVSWGPYLWAGPTPRLDGLFYARADLEADGIHPTFSGELKVAQQLEAFFDRSPYTPWWPE